MTWHRNEIASLAIAESVADPEGGKSGHGPPIEVGNGVWPSPRGAESVMVALYICRKVRILAPALSRSATDLAPPTEKDHIKTLKRSMTKKKVIRNFGR